jgi:hypothetical protein
MIIRSTGACAHVLHGYLDCKAAAQRSDKAFSKCAALRVRIVVSKCNLLAVSNFIKQITGILSCRKSLINFYPLCKIKTSAIEKHHLKEFVFERICYHYHLGTYDLGVELCPPLSLKWK